MTWRANGSTAFAELEDSESPFLPAASRSSAFAAEWEDGEARDADHESPGLVGLEFEGPYAAEFGREEGETIDAGRLRAQAAALAKAESLRWGNKTKKETDPAMYSSLKGYWMSLMSDADADRMIRNRDPWSAAFISWVMKHSGAGTSFSYNAAHRVYVSAAKRARLAGTPDKFWAYRVTEVRPEIGDLVCRDREKSKGVCGGTTYDNVDDGTARNTHSDLVVDVQPGKLISIGGNVSDSVGETKVTLDAGGLLVQPGGCQYFAIMKPPGSATTAPTAPAPAAAPAAAPTAASSWWDTISSLPGKVLAAVREKMITLQVAEAIIAGNRDENQLSDMLFYGRHPELPPGYQIKKTDTQLAQDWTTGRETIRLLLRAAP